MSRLEDLKEQLKAMAANVGQKISESQTYVQLQDRYQTLTPASQKLARALAALGLLLILVLYPMMLFFTSQSSITAFEDKRNLIRDLFKTYRESSARPNISTPPTVDALKSSINGILTLADLTPEQTNGITDINAEAGLIPPNLVSYGIEIRLSKLNIKQIVDIGANIVGLSDTVKMKDMAITAHAADPRYFDVDFKLYSLNVPEPIPDLPPEVEKPAKKGSTSKKSGDTE